MGSGGCAASGVQGQSPWSGGLGGGEGEAPQKLNTNIQFSPNFGGNFGKIPSFCKLLKLAPHVPWQFLL